MAGKSVQPLNNYTCRFRPSSLKYTDKSGLDGLKAGKQRAINAAYQPHADRRKMTFHSAENVIFWLALTFYRALGWKKNKDKFAVWAIENNMQPKTLQRIFDHRKLELT